MVIRGKGWICSDMARTDLESARNLTSKAAFVGRTTCVGRLILGYSDLVFETIGLPPSGSDLFLNLRGRHVGAEEWGLGSRGTLGRVALRAVHWDVATSSTS
jgi:hypothetical protein